MQTLFLTLKMLRRDLRAGELNLLVLALLLAVTALSSVAFLSERVAQGLKRDASQLLGGDLLITADHALPPRFAEQARSLGLRLTRTVTFNSMASTEAAAQLAAVKAVENAYPLRGSLQLGGVAGAPGREAGRIPAQGEAWVDETLLSALQLKPGERLQLGYLDLRIGAVISFESDRGMGFSSFAPRVMINALDLPASGLIQEGSRAHYRLQLAGAGKAVRAYEVWAASRLGRGERLESLDNARPEIRMALDRAGRFLRLTAMLSVVLAAVAIGLSSRRYLRRHFNACAVMRCFGARRGQLLSLYLGEFLILGLLVSALGCLLGFGVQYLFVGLARGLLPGELPAPGGLPVVHGLLVGMVLVLGFVAPQLLRLASVPPISVLRREWGHLQAASLGAWLLGAGALAGVMLWLAGEWWLGGIVVGGFALAIGVFAFLAWLALELLGRLRGMGRHWGLRYGLANLHRRRASSVVQIVALALGLTALILLSLVSQDLLTSWRGKLAPDAPNRFVINIQPDQREAVGAWLRSHGLDGVALEPMVRGRLISVNGRPVSARDYADERARNLVEREFNLSWNDRLAKANRIVAGAWHGAGREAVFSMEEGVGRTLGIVLGDRVVFEAGGQRVSGKVSSVRKLDWDSMQVNFFFIAAPGLLDALPASYITSFHLDAANAVQVRELLAAFPNLTVIDVSAVLAQVEGISTKLAQIVQFVFLFALLAGLLVLMAAQGSTHDERCYELNVLRALGARSQQIRTALLAELLALGSLAALLALLASQAMGYGLARFVFEMDYRPDYLASVGIGVLAVVLVLIFSWPSVSRAMRGTVTEGLRENETGAA